MTISTNSPEPNSPNPRGAVADAMTILRIALTPVIMALLIWQWPDTQIALLASFLFIIAAVTDLLDDWFGGSSVSHLRRFGLIDDAADTILITGTLIALSVVLWQNGVFAWTFAVPALVLILREIAVGLISGRALMARGWPDNWLSNAKGGFAMLGVALLVASPWLTQWIDSARATSDTIVKIYSSGSPYIWMAGQAALWVAALLSIISAYQIIRNPSLKTDPSA